MKHIFIKIVKNSQQTNLQKVHNNLLDSFRLHQQNNYQEKLMASFLNKKRTAQFLQLGERL